ncbi:MAG: class I SAM-dependent methyltransferase [bacterium]|nr:class I SAM-dependent methyltransferase [bacterium]
MAGSEDLSDEQRARIHEMKRAYWTQEGVGKEYQYVAHKPEPVTRIKNVSEISLVLRSVAGHRILDAGAGTGRFTLPLKRAGFDVVALDISEEMLREALVHSRKSGNVAPMLKGDIERLPFEDGAFDSVVSITVVRHFPNWRDILAEYVRVLRPGGRIVFDLASGEQESLLGALGLGGANTVDFDPSGFDATVTVRELAHSADELGMSLVSASPSDFFNANQLLKRVLVADELAFMTELTKVLDCKDAMVLYELVARRFLPLLSPALSTSWMIVLEKCADQTPYAPPYRQVTPEESSGSPWERIEGVLRQCAGAHYDEYARECAQVLQGSPEAQAFAAFCHEHLLPRLPVEALYWDANGGTNTP